MEVSTGVRLLHKRVYHFKPVEATAYLCMDEISYTGRTAKKILTLRDQKAGQVNEFN